MTVNTPPDGGKANSEPLARAPALVGSLRRDGSAKCGRSTEPAPVKPAPPPLPAPRDEEAAQIEVALKRVAKRAPRFAVSLAPVKGVTSISSEHSDLGGWSVRAVEAFGTRSPDFSSHMLSRVVGVARASGSPLPTEASLNAALAFVDGFAPDTEIEAMMATLLYATSDLALEMVVRAKQATDVTNLELSGNLAAKLLRSATAQAETLAKLRRGGEQTVRVEHVHVHAGGQAIVGNVLPGGGVPETIKEQSRAKPVAAIDYAAPALAPLWSEDAARDALPVACHAERAMPDARRH